MTGHCLICPHCFCKRLPKLSLKLKAFLSIISLGICVCILSAFCLENLSFSPNACGYSSRLEQYLAEDTGISPPGPWQFAGLWLGNDALYNSTTDAHDVKGYTGNEDHYLDKKITSPHNSRFKFIVPRKPLKVGDTVNFLIEARNQKGYPQIVGGDFWTGVLKSVTQKAYTAGHVTDFNNGTYLMTFILSWVGQADVEIKLLYPYRVTNWLRTRYRADNHYPTWHGTFQKGKQTKTANCYLAYGRIPTNVCEYRHYRALKNTRFFCRKPAGFSCAHLVGHRNVLPYGKVTANIMKVDHVDIFEGVEPHTFKAVPGAPTTLDIQANDNNEPAESYLKLPPCGKDLPISISDGYWMNHTWTSLICKPTLQYSPSLIRRCLRNHYIHLTGDSTTRQWFFSLTNALNVNIPGGNDKTKMKYKYFSDSSLNLNMTFTFHPITYQMSFIVNISEMRFEVDVILNLPRYTCNHVIVISPWTHFLTWPWESYIEWLTNIKSAIIEARKTCPDIKVVIKSPHALEDEMTSRTLMGVDILFWNMKHEMRNIFQGSGVFFVDIWDMDHSYPAQNDMHMPDHVINQEVALFLSYICN
ncbi:NXPE family member 4-like isoform X2 [Amphiura filiformis]|uniref:NXPE family member 4-like isoform X2 n=1 Tax=Amphiura filiformis TaxID=82378 RepID=UPI003B224B07